VPGKAAARRGAIDCSALPRCGPVSHNHLRSTAHRESRAARRQGRRVQSPREAQEQSSGTLLPQSVLGRNAPTASSTARQTKNGTISTIGTTASTSGSTGFDKKIVEQDQTTAQTQPIAAVTGTTHNQALEADPRLASDTAMVSASLAEENSACHSPTRVTQPTGTSSELPAAGSVKGRARMPEHQAASRLSAPGHRLG